MELTPPPLLSHQEDLIIPHHYTFYDFIVSKARGKSGPLFNFDVHDDVRLLADATVEKDESHAGKVVERSWYNRNKHIFPASSMSQREDANRKAYRADRPAFSLPPGWELYEPGKEFARYVALSFHAVFYSSLTSSSNSSFPSLFRSYSIHDRKK